MNKDSQYQPKSRDSNQLPSMLTTTVDQSTSTVTTQIIPLLTTSTYLAPAALFLDSLGYQHNKETTQTCNKHNITVYRIPPNTTAWLQPCDILLFGSAKQTVRKQHKSDRQFNVQSSLHRTCEQFSKALNAVSNSAVKRTWDRLRTYTPEQLKHKSSASTLKRAKSLFTGHTSSQP